MKDKEHVDVSALKTVLNSILKEREQYAENYREVFASFGLAMFRAQYLEKQLAITLAMENAPDPCKTTDAEYDKAFDAEYDKNNNKTLGVLVSEVEKVPELSEDEKAKLREAVKTRNRLAHHIAQEKWWDLHSGSEWNSMIAEFQNAADTFLALDEFYTYWSFKRISKPGLRQQIVDGLVKAKIESAPSGLTP